jgi:dihydrofolate synthase / folylpolyglutamate synthase
MLVGYRPGMWHVVFGAMSDKDVQGMLDALRPLVSTLHLCAPDLPRAMSTDGLAQLCDRLGIDRVLIHTSVADAMERASMRGPTLVCGSFHVADEALAWLER